MAETLQALRDEIDAVDAAIMGLLKQRLQVVQRVGLWKQHQGHPMHCPIRPAREVAVMQAAMAAAQGSLVNPAAAVAIWRHIINAALMVEGQMSLSAEASVQGEAQTYFGDYIPCQIHAAASAVVDDIIANRAMVGVVAADGPSPWWQVLAKQAEVKLFAALPFAGGAPKAYAFARLTPEPSGDDTSAWVVQGRLELHQGFAPPQAQGVCIGAFANPKNL